MSLPQAKRRYTPAEYYALERDATYKSDYYDGEIFAMAGTTSDHSLITANILGELRQLLKGKPCVVYESNLRLKVSTTGLRTYPDVSVYCGSLQYDTEDPAKTTALNPTVLFEVLSPSTEEYDRGFKGENYRHVESLRAYILVAQDRAYVEVRERSSGRAWSTRSMSGLDGILRLDCIGIGLPMSEIYANLKLNE